jgi:GNAT superfamily N-acetyltransferase
MSESGALCERLDWDSRFFGISIARAVPSRVDQAGCRALLDWCRAEKIECLYFLADASDTTGLLILDQAGFNHVDDRLTFELQPVPPAPMLQAGVRAARPEDIPALREIAATSHRDSRFYNDGRFDRDRCDELYRVWIENSCNGWADHVVAVEREGAAIGYLTVHLRDREVAVIGLVGVSPAFRRQGIGGQLLDGALTWIANRSAKRVSVVTQGRNSASRGFFLNAGFRQSARALWYHRWFAPETDNTR